MADDKKAAAAKRLKERTAKKRFKLPEGETTFRVLPNARGTNHNDYFEYGMHSEVGPRKAYIRCGKTMKGEKECWLCDVMLPKLEKSKNSASREAAERMARKDVFAVQIAYKSDDEWIGPILWEMSTGIANKLLGVLSNPKRDVVDPEKGYNLTISRTGTGPRDTRYGDMDRDDDPSEAPESAMKKLKPFSEVVRKYDEKDMKAAYYGHEQDEDETEEEAKKKKSEDEEEEEEETPKKKKKTEEEDEEEKPAKKKKREEEEEESEESESAEDEEIKSLDEDEDEKPAKKKKSKSEDEDELETALDEDVEEEKPAKKKKKHEEEDETEEEEEDEESKPKSKKKHTEKEDEDEDEVKPKKSKKKSSEEEDE